MHNEQANFSYFFLTALSSSALAESEIAFTYVDKSKPSFEQTVNVTKPIKKVVKHNFTKEQLIGFDNYPSMVGEQIPLLKKLFGPRYFELKRAFDESNAGPLYWNGKSLIGHAGAGKNDYHAIFEFSPDGNVKGALRDDSHDVATCTDFGDVEPGYFCKKHF